MAKTSFLRSYFKALKWPLLCVVAMFALWNSCLFFASMICRAQAIALVQRASDDLSIIKIAEKVNRNSPFDARVVIAATAQNVQQQIGCRLEALGQICRTFRQCHIVIYEHDSIDRSLAYLRYKETRMPFNASMTVLSQLGVIDYIRDPKDRIEHARNTLLAYTRKNFDDFDYFIGMNLNDDRFSDNGINTTVLNNVIEKAKRWDAAVFVANPDDILADMDNDLWALRSPKHSLFLELVKKLFVGTLGSIFDMNSHPNGFAIYKMNALKISSYDVDWIREQFDLNREVENSESTPPLPQRIRVAISQEPLFEKSFSSWRNDSSCGYFNKTV